MQRAVGIEELGARKAHVVEAGESVEERVEPARGRFGVVVQKDDVIAPGGCDTRVAGADEPLRLGVADDADAGDDVFDHGGFVGRGVIDQDHLEAGVVMGDEQRAEAVIGDFDLVMGGDDDADLGAVDHGKGDRLQLDGFMGAIERAGRDRERGGIEARHGMVEMGAQAAVAVIGARGQIGGIGRTGFAGDEVVRGQGTGGQDGQGQEDLAC